VGLPLLLEGDWRLLAEEQASWDIEAIKLTNDPFQAWLDADLINGAMVVRGRMNGDRFQSLGMDNRSIKISDLFINEKIPGRARKNWPLVCIDDEIVWVPGCRSAERYQLTGTTRRCLHLILRRSREELNLDR